MKLILDFYSLILLSNLKGEVNVRPCLDPLLAAIWILYEIGDLIVKAIKRLLGIKIREKPPASKPVQVWSRDEEQEEEDSSDFISGDEEW